MFSIFKCLTAFEFVYYVIILLCFLLSNKKFYSPKFTAKELFKYTFLLISELILPSIGIHLDKNKSSVH